MEIEPWRLHLHSAPPRRQAHLELGGSLQPLSSTQPAPAPGPEPHAPAPDPLGPRKPRTWLVGALAALAAFGGVAAWNAGRSHRGDRLEHAKLVIVSGHAAPKRTASGVEERWQKSRVTVTIDDSVDSLGPAARQAVESAFGAWLTSGAKVPALAFDSGSGTRVSLEPDGKNSVSLRTDRHSRATGTTWPSRLRSPTQEPERSSKPT